MTIENEELSDDQLFNAAVSDEPAEVPEKPVAEEQPEAPEPEVVAEEAEKPEAKPEARIPQWRRDEIAAEKNRAVDEANAAREQLAAERSQREELQRRLAALEKPAPAKAEEEPDPLLDPKGYREHMEKRFDERLLNERREISLANAHKVYKEEFQEAYAAAQKGVDPALRARMQQSRDPGETLIQWHREEKVKAEVGSDPAAYKQRLREEALKDPEFRKAAMEAWRNEGQPQVNGRPRVELPPSLSGTSRSNAALRSANDDVSDAELFDQTVG